MIQIKRPEECCGCTACAEKCPKRCISMQPDAEGFLYPVVDASLCIECGLCEKVCPVLHRYGAPEPASVRAYACCNRDEPVRMASSSGGVFSLLAGEVLDKGGVVFGARFDHDFSVVHDSVEEIAGLGTLRGSKYTQSRIEGSFRRAESLLKAGREVLFVGTSCQIAGLKRFLGRPYANLLAVDVLCHGVPSPKVYAQYFAQQTRRVNAEAQPATEPYRLAHLEFRNKEERGWGLYCIVSEYVRTNGGESQQLRLAVPFTHEMFMRGFLHNLYLRPSCHECPARRLAAGSDLTIADYWGVEEHHPEMNDNKGTSLVIPLSDRGRRAFAALSVSLKTIETPLQEALPGNPCLMRSVRPHRNRARFFAEFEHAEDLPALISRLTRRTLRERMRRKLRGGLRRIGLVR